MKNKGLLIVGGIAIVALGAFLWMRKKKEMDSEGATTDESKSDDSTSETGGTTTTTTGKGDAKPTANSPIPRTDGASVKGSGSAITPMTLKAKAINGVQDLDGTPLGLDISSALVNNDARLKIQGAIVNMNAGERLVLTYIAIVDAPTRASQEFKNALSSLLGANASSLADSVYNKLATASRFTPIATNQGAVGQLRDCRREAHDRGIRDVEFRQMYNYIKRCKEEGGFDSGFDGAYSFAQEVGGHAYSKQGFEIDKEDYEFNGDHIL
jgi:hypothetical protein